MQLLSIAFLAVASITLGCGLARPSLGSDVHPPVFDPADFTNQIDNPYFTWPIGKKSIYAAQTDSRRKQIEVGISGETHIIMGVKTLVYFDRAFVGGIVHEVTRDFIAQDKFGNVWYFGEEVSNYSNGKLRNHRGSWIAGVDGAKPGIWIKAKLVPGDIYQQEDYKGEAEDMAQVVSVDEKVRTGLGTFEGCGKILEWTPIEPEAKEFKYYCPQAGGLAVIEHLRTGERFELIRTENTGSDVLRRPMGE